MNTYQLTLSLSERWAIDWVGHRYPHGSDLYDILASCDWTADPESQAILGSSGWDAECDITFHFTEPLAWAVSELAEEGGHLWDCFSPRLVDKMNQLCAEIV